LKGDPRSTTRPTSRLMSRPRAIQEDYLISGKESGRTESTNGIDNKRDAS
jgi:hypothetical protein